MPIPTNTFSTLKKRKPGLVERRVNPRKRYQFESLEARRLLTANIDFASIPGLSEFTSAPLASDPGGNLYSLTAGEYREDGEFIIGVKRFNSETNVIWEQGLAPSDANGSLFSALRDGAMEVDSSGFIYIAAVVRTADLPVTADAIQKNLKGAANHYLLVIDGNQIDDDPVELSPSELVYATYFGGSGEQATGSVRNIGLGVNEVGDVFIAGTTRSPDFPTTSQPYVDSTLGPNSVEGVANIDGFLSKFIREADSYTLEFSSYVGGNQPDLFTDLSIDPAGIVHVVGFHSSTNFPYSDNAIAQNQTGDATPVLLRFQPNGELIYATALGIDAEGSTTFVATDTAGASYVATAIFAEGSQSLPISANAFQTTAATDPDDRSIFLGKIDSQGEVEFGTLYGGTVGSQTIESIAVDGNEAILVGTTWSTDLPVDGTQEEVAGGLDGFAVKFNSDGTDILGATYLGSDDRDFIWDAALSDGLLWVSGSTNGNFPTTDGTSGSGTFLVRVRFGDLPPLPGDANGDNEVSFADFLILSQNFGKQADAVFSDGDFDGNGVIEFADFLILSSNFGSSRT